MGHYHHLSVLFLPLFVTLSVMSGITIQAEARHLLETTLPQLPKPELPPLPPVPTLPQTELPPLPHVPTLPEPKLPTVPKPEIPKMPELPPLPHLPDLPKPTLATIPTLPKDLPLPSFCPPHPTTSP